VEVSRAVSESALVEQLQLQADAARQRLNPGAGAGGLSREWEKTTSSATLASSEAIVE
jgi:hypothetical protein